MKIVVSLLLLVLSFSANSQSKKYYRNVYQTIYGEYVGVYPIDSIQANKTNHYVYSFDDLNRVVSIESIERLSGYYLYSNILLSPMLEFEYEEDTKFIYNRVFDWDNETIRSEEYYVVNYAGNKVTQITTKSSVLDDEYFEESNLEFIYNSENQLIMLKMNGQSPYSFGYRGLANLDVKLNKNNQIATEIIEENLADPEFPIEYVKLEFSYDENGNFLTVKSFNEDNTLNNSGYNVAYTVYSYDKNGYETGKIMYGFENERVDYISTEYIYETEETLTYITPCETRSIYDSNGSLTSTKTYNKNGETFEDEFGIHEIEYKVDLNSGIYTEFYYNAKHQKVNGQMGFAGKEIHKDSKGRITYEKYLDSLDQPILNSFGVFVVVDEYQDEEGIIIETYLNADGSRMADNSGAYKYEKYIDQETSIFEKAFGIEGELLGEDEVYDLRTRYLNSESGLLISTSYFDSNRNPILGESNFFLELNTYSDNDYLMSTEYFDAELNPGNAYFGDLSYAKIDYKRDEQGNEIEMSYYDMDGNRAVDEYMISMYKTAYNNQGGIVQVDRYNTEMELLNPTIGYATVKYQYDSNFLLSEIAFYNHKEELWQDEQGIAKYTFVNENNQVVKKAFFNALGKPTTEPQGAYQIATSYFDGDNINDIIYLNKKGKKMNNLEGCHRVHYSYSESGNISRISLFNKKGKPVMADPLFYGTKFVFVEFVYDEAGYLLELNYFNEKGEIVYTQTS